MQSGSRPPTLPLLATLFIAGYFLLFSYDGLNGYFTFDDGLNLVHLHRLWEVSLQTAILQALQVFTTAYRPLGALFYRLLYQIFGFNPFPFRLAAYLLLMLNIVLAYRFARALDASREAAALSTLLFCYNASMIDLYYSTGTIYDLLCFPCYLGAVLIYARHRSKGRQLSFPGMLIVLALFLAALDAKEAAATLPAALLLYEILYRHRDYRQVRSLVPTCGFLLLMFAITAAYLRIKVGEMESNALYHPHLSVPFILTGIGHYFEQLFYLNPESFGPVKTAVALSLLLAAAAAARSRTAAYGTLFFAIAILPVSVIAGRSGYAAYVAYPGLTLALGVVLASARAALLRITRQHDLELASTVALFLCVAVLSVGCSAYTRKILMSYELWDQQRRIDFLTGLKRRIPEFPPNSRVLILDDPWGPDWAQMFLAELMYHDPSLWIDRIRNGSDGGDRESYDLLLTYKIPKLGTTPSRLFGVRKSWEIHWIPLGQGTFTLTAPDEGRAIRSISLFPAGQNVRLTVPGLANVKVDAIYRIVSSGRSTAQTAQGWCTLDAEGTCNIPAAQGEGTLNIDWIRPAQGRWIFTR
jgi:hypothetical protein